MKKRLLTWVSLTLSLILGVSSWGQSGSQYGVKYFYDINRSNMVSGVKVEKSTSGSSIPDMVRTFGIAIVKPGTLADEALFIDDTSVTSSLPVFITPIDPAGVGFGVYRDPAEGGQLLFSVDTRTPSYSLDPRVRMGYTTMPYLRLTDSGETTASLPLGVDANAGVVSAGAAVIVGNELYGQADEEAFKGLVTLRGDSTHDKAVGHFERFLVTDNIYTTGTGVIEAVSYAHSALGTLIARDSTTLNLLEGYGVNLSSADTPTTRPVFFMSQQGALALLTTGTLATGFPDAALSSGSLYAQNKVFAVNDISTSGTSTVDGNATVGGDVLIRGGIRIGGDLQVDGDMFAVKNMTVTGTFSANTYNTMEANEVIVGALTVSGASAFSGPIQTLGNVETSDTVMARKNLVVTGYTENGTFNRGLLSVTGNGVISNNFSVSGLTSLNGRSYLAAGQTQKYSNGYVYFKNWWNTSGTTTTVHFKLEGYSSPDFTKSAKFTVATNDATLTADSTAVWTHFRYIDRETGTVKSLSGVDSGFTSLSSDVTIFYVGNKTDSATQWNQVWETADTLDVTDDYFVKVYQCNAPLGGGTPTWVLKDIVLLRP